LIHIIIIMWIYLWSGNIMDPSYSGTAYWSQLSNKRAL